MVWFVIDGVSEGIWSSIIGVDEGNGWCGIILVDNGIVWNCCSGKWVDSDSCWFGLCLWVIGGIGYVDKCVGEGFGCGGGSCDGCCVFCFVVYCLVCIVVYCVGKSIRCSFVGVGEGDDRCCSILINGGGFWNGGCW